MSLFNDLQSSWADPQMRHALIVHWPVVLSVLSAILALALAIANAKATTLRIIALCICLGVMVSSYMALNSGEHAENDAPPISEQADQVLHEHEELGEKVPLFGAICAALVAITFIPKPAVRITAAWLAFATCAGTAAWVGNTAHHGGMLVYDFGVGMPSMQGLSANANRDSTSISQPANSSGFFSSQVQPILADHCIKCHNPTRVAAGKSAKLDQNSLEGILKGGRSGPAIVPGDPARSLLIHRVRGGDDPEEDMMPPPPNEPLTQQQIATLEHWIHELAASPEPRDD